MTEWFTSPETTPRQTAPSEALVRFVANNYSAVGDRFLDIGSGSGANADYLRKKLFNVCTIDSAPEARADRCADVSKMEWRWQDWFDCIYDINTLCHVEDPPYEAIYKALKPGGKFFSIHPADGTEVDMKGKGYTRVADILTMRRLLGRGFMRFTIHKTTNWNGDTKINAWQIEAEK